MNGKTLRNALRNGKRVYGTLLVSDSPFWPTIIAKIPGLDFVFIDTEHITIDDARLSWMCRTYDALNLAPVVRIPSPDPYRATKVIDMGARGIIAPYVETTEQVKMLVGAVKHRPLKGAFLDRLLDGDSDVVSDATRNDLRDSNNQNLLIVNIESVPAIEALDEIVAIDELDAVLIGPHDLTRSLGIPEAYESAAFVDAITRIITTARDAGKGAGIHYVYTQIGIGQEIDLARKGANLIVHSADAIAVRTTLSAEISQIREAMSDDLNQSAKDTIGI